MSLIRAGGGVKVNLTQQIKTSSSKKEVVNNDYERLPVDSSIHCLGVNNKGYKV